MTFSQFLDEADLLADRVAILRAPGELCAQGTPVALKNDLGAGFHIRVTLSKDHQHDWQKLANSLLDSLRSKCQDTSLRSMASIVHGRVEYDLNTSLSEQTELALSLLETEKAKGTIADYSVHNSSLDDVFQSLMTQEDVSEKASHPSNRIFEDEHSRDARASLDLTNGSKKHPLKQALTVFHKRSLIFRRSWVSLTLAVIVAICGSCIPLFFLSNRPQTCEVNFEVATNIPLFLPISPLFGTFFGTLANDSHVLEAPAGVVSRLGPITDSLHFTDFSDRSAFTSAVESGFRDLTLGGIVIPSANTSDTALLAWEASSPGFAGATLLNLVSNVLWQQSLNGTGQGSNGRVISANYQAFPTVNGSSLNSLRWVGFFGATMV